ISYVPRFARIVRGAVMSIREREFVQASHAIGNSNVRTVMLHILPNIVSPILVQGTVYFAYAILAEAALSYLGLGVPDPHPSWGNILYAGRSFMEIAWWLSVFPGLAISLAVLGVNLLGDGLRDELDP